MTSPACSRVEQCTSVDDRWLQLRRELWPQCPDHEHIAEMKQFGAFVIGPDAHNVEAVCHK